MARPIRPVCRAPKVPRRDRPILGAVLNCSESSMSGGGLRDPEEDKPARHGRLASRHPLCPVTSSRAESASVKDYETGNKPLSTPARREPLKPAGDCRHKDDGPLTMSPLVLSTMANNSLCSALGTLNFA